MVLSAANYLQETRVPEKQETGDLKVMFSKKTLLVGFDPRPSESSKKAQRLQTRFHRRDFTAKETADPPSKQKQILVSRVM